MAAGQTAREKLVRFLDQAASNPILCASPDGYSAALKAKLEHVQGPTERTRQRYRDEYAGAEEVRGRFPRRPWFIGGAARARTTPPAAAPRRAG
jgi:hypothetical protein